MAGLANRTRSLAWHMRLRLDGAFNVEVAVQCRTFLDLWEAQLETESAKWSERRLSLANLQQALQ